MNLGIVLLGAAWIAIAVGAANIASFKGRRAGRWFLAGLVLAPLIFVISIFVSFTPERKEQRMLQKLRAVKCPFCAELIRPDAIVCRFCNRDVVAPKYAGPVRGGAAYTEEELEQVFFATMNEQGIDPSSLTQEQLAELRSSFRDELGKQGLRVS